MASAFIHFYIRQLNFIKEETLKDIFEISLKNWLRLNIVLS